MKKRMKGVLIFLASLGILWVQPELRSPCPANKSQDVACFLFKDVVHP